MAVRLLCGTAGGPSALAGAVAEERLDELFAVEYAQLVDAFSNADVTDRDVELVADADYHAAFGRAVEPYRPMILEDPVPPDNVDTMAEVASKVGVPIATGERAIDLREFEVLMARHACQYVRPDVCAVGGITTSKKICALAEAHDVLVIPHNPLGPVSTAACLQICASIPNLGIQELPGFCLNGAEDKMVKEPLRFENGCMLIPEAPGIGIELADDAEELYPANERGSNAARRAFDGAVKDW